MAVFIGGAAIEPDGYEAFKVATRNGSSRSAATLGTPKRFADTLRVKGTAQFCGIVQTRSPMPQRGGTDQSSERGGAHFALLSATGIAVDHMSDDIRRTSTVIL